MNKTNQFNLTTKRYGIEAIQKMYDDESTDIFTVHASDKFGDNGLVFVVIVKKNHILEYENITAPYIRTAKNKPVEELYVERINREAWR